MSHSPASPIWPASSLLTDTSFEVFGLDPAKRQPGHSVGGTHYDA
jgi:hypothetical protein